MIWRCKDSEIFTGREEKAGRKSDSNIIFNEYLHVEKHKLPSSLSFDVRHAFQIKKLNKTSIFQLNFY